MSHMNYFSDGFCPFKSFTVKMHLQSIVSQQYASFSSISSTFWEQTPPDLHNCSSQCSCAVYLKIKCSWNSLRSDGENSPYKPTESQRVRQTMQWKWTIYFCFVLEAWNQELGTFRVGALKRCICIAFFNAAPMQKYVMCVHDHMQRPK